MMAFRYYPRKEQRLTETEDAQVFCENAERLCDDLQGYSTFLIDTIGTYLSGCTCSYKECIRDLEPREGFTDFIRHYHNQGKRILIHSDAFKGWQLRNISTRLGIDQYIDGYHGSDSSDFIKRHQKAKKNYAVMSEIEDMNLEESLVIGDAASEYESTQAHGISYFETPYFLPGMIQDGFSFNHFIR